MAKSAGKSGAGAGAAAGKSAKADAPKSGLAARTKPSDMKKAPAESVKKPAAKRAAESKARPAAAAAPAKAKAKPAATPKSAVSKSAAPKPAAKTVKAAKPAAAAAVAPTKAAAKAAPKPRATKSATTKPVAMKAAAVPAETPVAETAKPAAAKPASKAKASEKPTSASKPWLASYPKEIPAEIGPIPYQSIGDLLADSVKKFSTRPAFTCMDKTLTYAQIGEASQSFAAFLQSKGLQKGARVAIMMPNVLQYPIAMMAVLRAGYTVVNVNPLYTPRELEHQLKDSGAEAIIILENFAHTLQSIVAKTNVKHIVVAAMGDLLGLKGHIVNLVVRRVKKLVPAWSLPGHIKFNDALKAGSRATFKPAKVGPDDVAFLQYTGGTTGVSKGATLLHRNVLANVAQNDVWVQTAYLKRAKPDRLVYVCALPLYHIYALTVNALMGMQQGAQNILIPNPRDIPAFVKELGKYPFNIFPGLNTLFNALLNNPDFQKLDFKPLSLTFAGGMAAQKAVSERWQKLTGCIISEGYGLSETSPVATANRFDASEFTGTIGIPIPSTEITIRDDDGNDLPLGDVGEICIKGPQVMAGYWNRPEETAKVMTADGFFKSGDMGFMDTRGYVKIVDRKKDMILVSGFNVYPNEIEDVAATHPGVLECAAIGVPDEKSGETPKLFVVKKDPALTADALKAYLRENLTGYKMPKYIEFRTDLPKTNVGKILRRELRG
ncbi:long-chain acyl-CoA synthetase [Mesorhizobium australicum]|uniref:Long-chain-fatty-acid--CoA ligase n=2 Tax=Mesorhizobium australicum TaxID=536018 RepID=A0A1X7NKH4_9HYPH|nr:long-chain acyl-CoA synthetase [Mesorhizobium australicum]